MVQPYAHLGKDEVRVLKCFLWIRCQDQLKVRVKHFNYFLYQDAHLVLAFLQVIIQSQLRELK